MRHDPISAILTDLLRRVDGLAGQRGHVSVLRLHDEVDQIRHIARAFHLDQVEGLAGTLESALSLHGLGPVVLSYLDLLRDAIGAEIPVGSIASLVPRTAPAAVIPLRV
ncbi:hypothetical protein [Sphingobium sp.]|uniref:hypothetical protein n=1 Tax=Sphingobium sp. TaxID=1912891 RepID=UPI002B6D5483|nr:hypothetical protein [Sphingobium sp.]HUD93682.1 hypothetical protein [Sphingobium sp.]